MDLFIYSDESGVFDKVHNEIYVYGGLIFLGKDQKDIFARKYLVAEKFLRTNKYLNNEELKACKISNKEKGKLFRSMNGAIKFGVIINQKKVLEQIFKSKKDKQRYLDFAYKIGLKKSLQNMIDDGVIDKSNIDNIHIFSDEHTTATNSKYELRESLEQEFKNGTYNSVYDKYFPPLFKDMLGIDLRNCDSKKETLVRAADIVANRIYFMALNHKIEKLNDFYLTSLPF